jgi:pimeloyl-ACP methyl ester carboxylesterase
MKRFRFLLVATLLTGITCIASAQHPVAPTRNEITANDGHRLVLWGKRPAGVPKGEIVLLHGRTWSGLPNFDLQVRGQRVSVLDALVAKGYAAYALDQRGYGATRRDATGWLTPDRAVLDAVAALDWVASQSPGSRRPALLGYSRGSQTAMLVAQRRPASLSALVMYGAYYDGDSIPPLVPEPRSPPRARTTAEGAAEDFITPESTPGGVKDAYVREALRNDPVRVDWRREEQYNVLDPARIRVPTLLLNGERDPYSKDAGLPGLFAKLAGVDKAWVVLAATDHVAHLERQAAWISAIVGFLERD